MRGTVSYGRYTRTARVRNSEAIQDVQRKAVADEFWQSVRDTAAVKIKKPNGKPRRRVSGML